MHFDDDTLTHVGHICVTYGSYMCQWVIYVSPMGHICVIYVYTYMRWPGAGDASQSACIAMRFDDDTLTHVGHTCVTYASYMCQLVIYVSPMGHVCVIYVYTYLRWPEAGDASRSAGMAMRFAKAT